MRAESVIAEPQRDLKQRNKDNYRDTGRPDQCGLNGVCPGDQGGIFHVAYPGQVAGPV